MPSRVTSARRKSIFKPAAAALRRAVRMALGRNRRRPPASRGRARVMALVPVPQPRSRALPGLVPARNSITSGGVMFVSQGLCPCQQRHWR